MSKKLSVYLNKIFTGIFAQDVSGRLSFTYDSEYLKSSSAQPLSISLPLQTDSFEDRIARPFFSGFLPDDLQRQILAKNLGLSEKNPFALLSKVGGDCAGAIEVNAPDHKPSLANKSTNEALTALKITKIIKDLPTNPLLAGTSKIRLSLAGAQSKLAVFFDEKKDSFPHLIDNAPSTHILKPAILDLPDTVYNEFFCMKLAGKSGLDVAKVFLKLDPQPYLLIRRFDRSKNSKNEITRLHQEDFCQALSIPPELKYQNEGGPSIALGLELIEKNSILPALDKLKFTHAIIFNYLIGNCDAHGKNFSFLHVKNGVKLAPLYDLICTRAYPKLNQRMAMKIGSSYKTDPLLSLRHWHSIVPNTNTARSSLNKDLKTFATKLPKKAVELKIELEKAGIKSGIFDKVIEVINKRCEYILKYFEG